MRWSDNDVQIGMFVTSTNGEKLGKVIRCDAETFWVEKGFLFPKDYELAYEYITSVDGNNVTYALAGADVQPKTAAEPERRARTAEASTLAAPAAAAASRGAASESEWGARSAEASRPTAPAPAPAFRAAAPEPEWSAEASKPTAPAAAPAFRAPTVAEPERSARSAEASRLTTPVAAPASEGAARLGDAEAQRSRIALMDEEIGIEKVPRETGHVRVKKVVRTEERHVTVPVKREDVVIERVPVSRDAAALSREEGGFGEPSFQEETIDILLHEEELQVTKRPVVREEVVVRTVVQSAEREAVAMLRHEDAEFEDTRQAPKGRPEERESSPELSGYASPGWRG